MVYRRFHRVLLLAGYSLLLACAQDPPYQRVSQSFPVSRVIQDLGNDYQETKLDGNRTRYTWSWTKSTLVRSRQPPTMPLQGPTQTVQAVNVSCEVSVISDAAGQVTATRTTGSGCTRILGTDFWLR